MASVILGATSDVANPLAPFVFFMQDGGISKDPVFLHYKLIEPDGSIALQADVDLVNEKIVTVDPPGVGSPLGRFAPGITINPLSPSGIWKIEWSWQLTSAHPIKKATQDFEVLPSAITVQPAGPLYGFIQDMRDEGATTNDANDARCLKALLKASTYIERICRQFFEPRYFRASYDGNGSKTLVLDVVPISVEGMHFATSPLFPSDLPVEPDFFRVYNRHLSGLISPDDRASPRIELFSSSEDLAGIRPFTFSRLLFPRGQRNIDVVGAWGCTEHDGTPFGRTPMDIREAAMLLAFRNIPASSDQDAVEEAQQRWRIKSMRTRDQSIDLNDPSAFGPATPWTGDPRIDTILARYQAPMQMGAA